MEMSLHLTTPTSLPALFASCVATGAAAFLTALTGLPTGLATTETTTAAADVIGGGCDGEVDSCCCCCLARYSVTSRSNLEKNAKLF
jgi:hypothetical protein